MSDAGQREITVRDGEVGISHDNGVLVVLPPGRHVIDKPGHRFDELLSTQQQCLPLTKSDARGAWTVCETSELVRVGVQATVFYKIQDPKLAVSSIGVRKAIEGFITDTATAVVTTFIRKTSLAEVAQGAKAMPDVSNSGPEEDFIPGLPFFDRLRGAFLGRLKEPFLGTYGIDMLHVRIGDFKVLDTSTSSDARFAEIQADLASLEGRRQTDL